MTHPEQSRPPEYHVIPLNTPQCRPRPPSAPSPALGEGNHHNRPLASAFQTKGQNKQMIEPEPHFPEPRPCGNYLCDQDHDGPCWTCGEPWPCEAARKESIRRGSVNEQGLIAKLTGDRSYYAGREELMRVALNADSLAAISHPSPPSDGEVEG